ncbi:MAG: hypothetical protein KC416_12505 [Myxococcales bacterium]|nr:hypothetical protein [Myxococcales bacterium]
MTEAGEILRDTLPRLFLQGLDELQSRTDAEQRLRTEEALAAEGISAVRVEGTGEEFWFQVRGGQLMVLDTKPEGPLRLAAVIPEDAWSSGLSAFRAGADRAAGSVAQALVALTSARLSEALAGQSLSCALTIHGAPDFGARPFLLGLQTDGFPAAGDFSVDVDFHDVERLLQGEVTPAELFMGGSLRLGGDYAPALNLAMGLLD